MDTSSAELESPPANAETTPLIVESTDTGTDEIDPSAAEPMAEMDDPAESAETTSPAVEPTTASTDASPDEGDLARGFIEKANAALNREENAEAIEMAQKAVEAIPNAGEGIAHEAWQTLGVAQQISGLSAEAETSLRRAADLDPDCAMTLHYLASSIAGQERCTEAIPIYKNASEMATGDSAILGGLARCYDAVGNPSAANQVRAKAIEVDAATEATAP